ncbi:MAG: Lacal_2735 family protein [Reichenbachiella sp.]
MFRLFKRPTKAQILERNYRKLIEESHKLSRTNRTLSDQKFVEAQAIIDQLEKI